MHHGQCPDDQSGGHRWIEFREARVGRLERALKMRFVKLTRPVLAPQRSTVRRNVLVR